MTIEIKLVIKIEKKKRPAKSKKEKQQSISQSTVIITQK